MSVSDNEVNEMLSYLSKDPEVPSEKVKQVFSSVYKEAKAVPSLPATLTRADFEAALQKATQPERLEEELLYLFYNLDREKKGYLVPEDIVGMFEAVGRKITLN